MNSLESVIFVKAPAEQDTKSTIASCKLTPIVCKMMEAILKSSLMERLQRTASLSTAQYGFVLKISCLTNLLLTEEWLTRNIDAEEVADIIFLDF